MTQSFSIIGKLPGYNQLKGHWATSARAKARAMEIVGWSAKLARIKPVKARCTVKIVCYEPDAMRDPSNVRSGAEKVILDALQNMGIIKNDNWKRLKDTPAIVTIDRARPRIEVTIEEVCDE